MSGDIAANLAAVRARIDAACRAAGRDPGEVTLLPVSKTHPIDLLEAAYAAGERTFGESRVQEAESKAEAYAGRGVRWVFIGHLQTNKAKNVAAFADELQTLDSLKLAEALDRRLQALGRGLDVLVQVNASGEEQKSGLAPDDVPEFARQLGAYASLRPRGLMTMAMQSDDRAEVRACFGRVRELSERLRADGVPGEWDTLSMGMSGDLEEAIAEGATVVRVGTAIFGSRPPA
ncbi:YggS family pyridoxal phosphate-dependent enzyme [Mariniluteicoccus flavus]